MVLVAVALVALIGSAALVLLAGSVEWQGNQLQQLADQAALDSALKIGVGCDAGKASTVITEADTFIAAQRGSPSALSITGGSCTAPYTGTDVLAGGLTAVIHYPYRAQQQLVEVILTLTLPISFGGEVGRTSTQVIRRAVAQALPGSTFAISATTLTCSSGQVNVAGSILVQNPILRTGTCALYAHARFDATSGTYSDLGDVSVYTDGPWNAPGTCSPGFNTGSLSAICSDGFELSGHATLACGTVLQSYLLAGDKTINPNPCAAGKAPQPVAPVSVLLPPEPDTDLAAIGTLQGTGGAACAPGTTTSNIVVNGVTVGTAHTPSAALPSTMPDASGFYHFKPSCYGYLNPGALSGAAGISNLQTGAKSPVTRPTVTPTLPVASQAGTLLVVDIRSDPTDIAFTPPPGIPWVLANSINEDQGARTEIWYYPNNPGGITSAIFRNSDSVDAIAQMTEWSGVLTVAPLDKTGTLATGSRGTVTLSTSAATTSANELVITDVGLDVRSPQTYTRGSGWTSLVSDMNNGFAAEYRLNLAAGVASETISVSQDVRWSAVIAAFKPAPATAGSAVLDPGFYYFNGSGFAGGGGICLNGGNLLARDVTLEFVNQAGLSSGTCAPGGGANCGGSCQFGSPPCSLQVCPPNAAADSPNNLTWFAAPCSVAPATADSASCLGGTSWCPAGDRSCTNMLIWAPPSNTLGQIAINGPAADAWLLGSIFWTGTCSYTDTGTSLIAGSISCGNLSISAVAGAGLSVGSAAGISTALVEAVLVE
jgi:hypothetical protein